MGKVVKFTGSKLLGEELRRLRGQRTLRDVVELGKTKLVPHGFKSVGMGTLSEIETGKSLPNLESLFALSVLYQVPTSRFLNLLLEENLIARLHPDTSLDVVRERFVEASAARDWTLALGLAVEAQRRAPDGWESVRWRANRAIAMEALGMRWDAIGELNHCLESPDVPATSRYRLHNELSRMHAAAGQFSLADMHARECIALAPDDAPAEDKCRMLQNRALYILRRKEWGLDPTPARLDEARELVSAALTLVSPQDIQTSLGLELVRATISHYEGDDRSARRGLEKVLARTEGRDDLAIRRIDALRALAKLDVSVNAARARTRLMLAGELAMDRNLTDHAFLVFHELAKVAENPEQRGLCIRKCRRLYPLVQSNHPAVREFEQETRREVQ